MNNLIRKPAPAPTKPFESSTDDAATAKKNYNASVRITTDTRNKLNALRKISKFKNIDDLLEEMIESRVKELNSHDKVKFEVLIEE